MLCNTAGQLINMSIPLCRWQTRIQTLVNAKIIQRHKHRICITVTKVSLSQVFRLDLNDGVIGKVLNIFCAIRIKSIQLGMCQNNFCRRQFFAQGDGKQGCSAVVLLCGSCIFDAHHDSKLGLCD